MFTTISTSIPASLKYLISTSCSKLSQSVDIISHVKYLNCLRKYFQDSSKFRIVLFFIICHTYYGHTHAFLVTKQYTDNCRYMTTFQKRRTFGYRRLLCNQFLQTFVKIWMVLCILLKKSFSPSNMRMNIGEIVIGDVFKYTHTHLKASSTC